MKKPKQPLTLKQIGDLGPKAVRVDDWVPRAKREGEATPPDPSFGWKRLPEYVTGDGDHNIYIPRAGSCHKHLKSLGT